MKTPADASRFLDAYAATLEETSPESLLAQGRIVTTCSCADTDCPGLQVIPGTEYDPEGGETVLTGRVLYPAHGALMLLSVNDHKEYQPICGNET